MNSEKPELNQLDKSRHASPEAKSGKALQPLDAKRTQADCGKTKRGMWNVRGESASKAYPRPVTKSLGLSGFLPIIQEQPSITPEFYVAEQSYRRYFTVAVKDIAVVFRLSVDPPPSAFPYGIRACGYH